MQAELDADYASLDIQLLGVNKVGREDGNSTAVEGRDIPLLQDVDSDGDGASDAWKLWNAEWRDVVILDKNNETFATYNLTTYNLAVPDNYNALRQLLIDAASVQFSLNDDIAVTRPETSVDIAVLANDGDSQHTNLVLEGVDQPANGSAEIVTITYSPDLEPKEANPPALIISEVSPGNHIELFNTTGDPIDLGTVAQQLSSAPIYLSVASLAGGQTVEGREFVTIAWPEAFSDTDAGGEIALFRGPAGSENATRIDDFLAWGINPHDSHLSLAQSTGKWEGSSAPSLVRNSISRIPQTVGNGSAAYDTTRPASPGETMDTYVATMQFVRYLPDPNFIGQDSFAYTATDEAGLEGIGQIAVTVGTDAPLWQNPNEAMDVDGNGLVLPLDVLLVINGLNQGGSRSLPTSLVAPNIPPPFMDASGNGSLEPLDVLLVVNWLNGDGNTGGEAEGEAIEAFHGISASVSVALNAATGPTDRQRTDISQAERLSEIAVDSLTRYAPFLPQPGATTGTGAKYVERKSGMDPSLVDAVLATDLVELLPLD